MKTTFTFQDVVETLKNYGKDDTSFLDDIGSFAGLALICSPFFFGPQVAAALPALAVKNEIVNIGKRLCKKFLPKKEAPYAEHYEAMRTAYGLLVFSAFFEALDAALPEDVRQGLKLTEEEYKTLLAEAAKQTISITNEKETLTAFGISFPAPAETVETQNQRLSKIWTSMAQALQERIHELPYWASATPAQQLACMTAMHNMGENTAQRFQEMYYELCCRFPYFAMWANLQEHATTQNQVHELSAHVQNYVALKSQAESRIDVGLKQLRHAVLSMPQVARRGEAVEIFESFDKFYQARIHDPIVRVEDTGESTNLQLAFPKLCDAFVPQAYKLIEKKQNSLSFEDPSLWREVPRRKDLNAFFVSYLSSPYSTEKPLLILGHPGSGKSVLSTVLATQLMSSAYTVFRIPLREVNADAGIAEQIEQYIKRITSVDFNSWNTLKAVFKDYPPVVILDGYDELLQASGNVFANYIMDAQKFQQHHSEQGWPLRVIITSRVTLIDKATVPTGSTVLRLMEFDQDQRKCWIGIWNKTNAPYFRETDIAPFALPDKNDDGAEKILELAEQPLLLLMLAIYDSDNNILHASTGLDRSQLYNNLLRRFVKREKSKEKSFFEGRSAEQEKEITKEMRRLGAAALGMFNRRKVHILAGELNSDLQHLELLRDIRPEASAGRVLTQAELLLGSFFFIHESQAQHHSGTAENHEESQAYEFLHNTFGEFLAADFILREVAGHAKRLLREEEEGDYPPLHKREADDIFRKTWFESLIYAPLFSRPVILSMLIEWTPHVLQSLDLDEEEFTQILDKMLLHQLRMVLDQRLMPKCLCQEGSSRGNHDSVQHPLMGHLAIYSLNLLLVRLNTSLQELVLDEKAFCAHEDGTRPWDRLTHLWRSWFSLSTLAGLCDCMQAHRSGTSIAIDSMGSMGFIDDDDKLSAFHNVANTLGDNICAGLSGLHAYIPNAFHADELPELHKKLEDEGIDATAETALFQLMDMSIKDEIDLQKFIEIAEKSLQASIINAKHHYIELASSIISRILEEEWSKHSDKNDFREIFDRMNSLVVYSEIAIRNARAAQKIFFIAKKLHSTHFINKFITQLVARIFESVHTVHYMTLNSGSSSLVALLNDIYTYIKNNNVTLSLLYIKSNFYNNTFISTIKISQSAPETVFALLRLFQLLNNNLFTAAQKTCRTEINEFLNERTHLATVKQFSKSHPPSALAYMHILHLLGGGDAYKTCFKGMTLTEVCANFLLQPRCLLALGQGATPDLRKFLQEVKILMGDGPFAQHLAHNIDDEVRQKLFPLGQSIFEDGVQSLALHLAMARLLMPKEGLSTLCTALHEAMENPHRFREMLAELPLSGLADVLWFAELRDMPDLREQALKALRDTGLNVSIH